VRNLDFYSAAATLFPILFLVMLVEQRLFARDEDRTSKEQLSLLFDLTLLMLIFGVGVFTALRGLDTGHPGHVSHSAVVATLGAAFMLLGMRVLFEQARDIGCMATTLSSIPGNLPR
jgi:hypothetical protein